MEVSGTNIEPETYAPKATKGAEAPASISVRAGGTPAAPRRKFLGLTSPQLYTLLGLAQLGLALMLSLGSEMMAKFVFGSAADPPEEQHSHLFRLYASSLATSAASLFALEELARRNLLHSYTSDILKMGLIAHSTGTAALMLLSPGTLTLGWVALEGSTALATFMLPAASLLFSCNDRSRVWRDVQNIPNWAAGAFTGPRRRFSWLATLYNLLTLNIFATGLSYLLIPSFTLYHTFGYDYGKSAQYLWQLMGLGGLMTLLPAATMALKHKADIQRMSATPARTLNAGLMATAMGHLLVLGALLTKGQGGSMLLGILAVWGSVLGISMLGLGAPEATQLIEETMAEAKKK